MISNVFWAADILIKIEKNQEEAIVYKGLAGNICGCSARFGWAKYLGEGMETITLILVMCVAVFLSSVLVRMLPIPLPTPLVQIALGMCIGMVSTWRLELEPEVFFLLFLPPLLFLDGWRIPKDGLFRDKWLILALALGLVVFTVVGVGYFVHWLIPAMPLAVAFALAAVISPTDPVALSAIISRVPMPARLMHILEGESLLNDASGLVCLRFAVAAVLTGSFVLSQAFISFLYLAIGGLLIGFAVTWTVNYGRMWAVRHYGEDSGSQILASLLIPFFAYLIAEHLQCSGILAAVAAGITMSFSEMTGKSLAITRVRRTAVWDMFQFALNGLIFVLLGEQLPGIIADAGRVSFEMGHESALWLVVYILLINLALGVMRFVWVWLMLQVLFFNKKEQALKASVPAWRLAAVTAFAGVRGAITLAGVLTIPLVLNDGAPFPGRDMAILLAAGVIIMSLVIASVGMPAMLKSMKFPPVGAHQDELLRARAVSSEAAIRAIEKAQHTMSKGRPDVDSYVQVAARLTEWYRQRMQWYSGEDENDNELNKLQRSIEDQLRLVGLRAERDEIFRLIRTRQLSEEVGKKMIRDLDFQDHTEQDSGYI